MDIQHHIAEDDDMCYNCYSATSRVVTGHKFLDVAVKGLRHNCGENIVALGLFGGS
jgi:hypothetical protein